MMKGEFYLIGGIIPIKSIFHLITVIIVLAVGEDLRGVDGDAVFAKNFGYKF